MMAHIDTVPLCVGARPVRKGNCVTSRDSDTALGADDRAGAAVVLTAALEILRQGLPHPPLTLFWPVQEENGLYGARFVSHQKLGNPKLCFNWDGFDAAMVCIGATGDYSIDVTIEGIASHAGGHPEQGVSAIVIAGKAIADLQENGWHGLVIKGNNSGASNIGMVSGGDATNVVAPSTQLKAEVRSHDPKFRKRILSEFEKAFKRAAKSVKNDKGKSGKIRFVSALKYESFQLNASETVVQETVAALESMGLTGELRVSNGGLDANWMSSRGLPTVTLGCGQMNPHTVNEALDLEMFQEACRIGVVLATRE